MKNILKKPLLALAFTGLFVAGSAQAALSDLTTWNTSLGAGGSVSLATNNAIMYATSSISQNVNYATSFDWFFNAEDYLPYNDYGWFSLDGVVTTLASVSSVGDYGNSGWNTYTFGSAFTGLLAFGSTNVGDTQLDSTLTIKNVNVPEPATLALLGLGLAGISLAKKRKAVH